jgi:hypothetical protein
MELPFIGWNCFTLPGPGLCSSPACRDNAPKERGVKAAFGREMSIAGPAGFVMMPPA